MDYFIFFLLGALAMRVVQFILAINDGYKIFKYSELYAMYIVINANVWKNQCLEIMRIVYEDANSTHDYEIIKEAINKKFVEVQVNLIRLIKERLPYKIQYSTLAEADKYVKDGLKDFLGEDYGKRQ